MFISAGEGYINSKFITDFAVHFDGFGADAQKLFVVKAFLPGGINESNYRPYRIIATFTDRAGAQNWLGNLVDKLNAENCNQIPLFSEDDGSVL